MPTSPYPQTTADLAGHHDIRAAADTVNEGFAAAVPVVKLGLGDTVIHVDRRERQLAVLLHLVKTQDAGRRFLGNALDQVTLLGEPARMRCHAFLDLSEQALFFFGLRIFDQAGFACLDARTHENVQRGVAAIVEDHVRTIGEVEDLVGVVPVFFQCLALDCENRNAGCGNSSCGLVLRGKDVAGRPADFCAQRNERFNQNGRLDGHVQGPCNTGTLQRLGVAEFFAACHEARHFVLGDLDFGAAPVSEP